LLKRYGVSPRFLAACVSAIAILLQGPSAAAEGEPAPADPWAHRPVSLLTRMEAGGGEMGPTGLVGLVLEITPARWFSLSGDAGAGFDGTQLAAMARGRLFVTKNTALGLGVGASSGAYVDTDEPWLDFCFVDCPRYHRREWGSASWGNAELSLEGRTGGGFEWRLFVGVQSLLDPNDGVCTSTVPCPTTPGVYGYIGSELGYAVGAWN
jgi:hypothetical protein